MISNSYSPWSSCSQMRRRLAMAVLVRELAPVTNSLSRYLDRSPPNLYMLESLPPGTPKRAVLIGPLYPGLVVA